MVKAQKFVCSSIFNGEPKLSDFCLQSEELPVVLNDGDVLIEAIYWSVDPYMRVQMPQLPVNSPMIGENIARVIESKDPAFPVDSYVWNFSGWRDFMVFNNKLDRERSANHIPPYVITPIENIPLSARLGVLGMTGLSAYFGLLDICAPKPNETIVVSGAAGAVGSIVGQIGKLLKCRVIGLAGSADKCRCLEDELNFDIAIDYKSENFNEALKAATPNGIDVYFDNVGGELSAAVISQMNHSGRVSACGSISTYNLEAPNATILSNHPSAIAKQLKIEEFIVTRWIDRWSEGVAQLSQWILTGQLKYRETISSGFETLPSAFIGMLRGENIGKALVRK